VKLPKLTTNGLTNPATASSRNWQWRLSSSSWQSLRDEFASVAASRELAPDWSMTMGKVDLIFGLICIVTLTFSIVLLNTLKIHVKLSPLLSFCEVGVFFLALAVICARPIPRIAQIAKVLFWSMVFTNVFPLPIFLSIRLEMPFHDGLLADADRLLGLEVPAILGYLTQFPILSEGLNYLYDSLVSLMLVALILPAALGQKDKSHEFLLAIPLSAMATLIILSFIQAIGPWVHYTQITATESQQHATRVLQALKSWKPMVFDFEHVEPLVALPSWHTILATLSAVALWGGFVGYVGLQPSGQPPW